jgi:hypothetical protein
VSAYSATIDAKLVRELEDGLPCPVASDQFVKLDLTKLVSDAAPARRRQHAEIGIFLGQSLFEEALHRWMMVGKRLDQVHRSVLPHPPSRRIGPRGFAREIAWLYKSVGLTVMVNTVL